MKPDVPLVVPEVNGDRARRAQRRDRGAELLDDPADGRAQATPRCGRPAKRARRDVPVRVRAGKQSMERLLAERVEDHDLRGDWTYEGEEFEEEAKIREETRKILELPELPVQAICVRVPVLVGHLEAVWIETEDALGPEQARELLGGRAGFARRRLPQPRAGREARTKCSSAACAETRRRRTARADGRRRQPAQGRGAERRADRRAAGRTLGARGLSDRLAERAATLLGMRCGTGAGTNASRSLRSTSARLPSSTGCSPPSSSRQSSTRPCARSVRKPKSARKSRGNTVRWTSKRSYADSPSG